MTILIILWLIGLGVSAEFVWRWGYWAGRRDEYREMTGPAVRTKADE